jgi:hypothetical protein
LSAFLIGSKEAGRSVSTFESAFFSASASRFLFFFFTVVVVFFSMAAVALPEDIYLALNSDLAQQVSTNGSEFSVDFQPALSLPSSARNVSVALIQGTFWWTIPNISDCVIQLTARSTSGLQVPLTVSVPRGLYNYKQINTLISNTLLNAGFAKDLITFVENGATSTIDLAFTGPASLLFPLTSCWKQFGYLPDVEYRYVSSADPVYNTKFISAPAQASFDTIQFLTVGTNLVNKGFQLNGGVYKGVIANVPINASPGYQITALPSVPLDVSTDVFNSAGGLSRGTFTLMDQDGFPVDTNGEAWTLLLRIRYYV